MRAKNIDLSHSVICMYAHTHITYIECMYIHILVHKFKQEQLIQTCTYYIHTMYILCTYYVHTMYILCTYYVHTMYIHAQKMYNAPFYNSPPTDLRERRNPMVASRQRKEMAHPM